MTTPDVALFRTHRLPLAAFLLARGLEMDHTTRESTTVVFFFRDVPRCEQLRDEFLTATPPEKVFWNKLNDAKDIIFANK